MDHVLCSTCGLDLTSSYDPARDREPCPNCGGVNRTFQVIVSATVGLSASASAQVVQPPTISAEGEALPPEIVQSPPPDVVTPDEVALRFEHLVRTFPPRQPGDKYLIEIESPDTGFVSHAVADDAQTAWEQLAEPFADDV
jgi:hypothetical protein